MKTTVNMHFETTPTVEVANYGFSYCITLSGAGYLADAVNCFVPHLAALMALRDAIDNHLAVLHDAALLELHADEMRREKLAKVA